MFGSKEIGSKSSSLFGLCALVLQSPVISVVTAVQWAAVAVGEKTSGWCTSPHPPLVTQIDPPANPAFYSSSQIAARSETGPKKGAKSGPDINVGNWLGQVKRRWGPQLAGFYPAAHLLAAPAPVAPLRCFNPPAAAGRNSRAAPVTAKTSRGDGHWSVGDQQLAEADV